MAKKKTATLHHDRTVLPHQAVPQPTTMKTPMGSNFLAPQAGMSATTDSDYDGE